AVHGTVGTSGHESAEKAARQSVQQSTGQLGRRDARDAKSRTGRKWKKSSSFFFTRFGTSETKVCEGCEPAEKPKDGPFRAVWRFFSGTAGTK
ncbi:hypothetical protein KI387_021561, partial [Taxus chinensis]